MDRDSAISTLFKGGSILFLGLVFDLGISFVAQLLIARYLGAVDYGAISIGMALLTMGSVLVIMGLDTGMARYLPRYDDPAAKQGVILSGVGLALPTALVVSGIIVWQAEFLAAVAFDAPETAPVIRVFAAAIPFAAFVRLSLGIVRGMQWSFPKAIIQNVAIPLSRFSLVALGLALGLGVFELSFAYTLPFVIGSGIGLYYVWKTPIPIVRTPSRLPYRELLVFSTPLIVTTVMLKILNDIDTFILGYFQGTGDVGIYNVIYPLGELLTVGLSALSFIFMPVISDLHSDGKHAEMRRIYQVSTKWNFMLTFPIAAVLLLFPTTVISLTFGAEYTAGASALSILGVGMFVHSVMGLNGSALTSIGRTRVIAVDNVIVAATNVALNVVLIPQYSYYGAAFATTVSYVLLNALYSVQLYRSTDVQPFSTAMVRPGAIAFGMVAVLYLVTSRLLTVTPITLVASFGVFLVLYGLIIVRFGGIQREEVMLINSLEEQFGVDLEPVKRIVRGLLD